MKKLLLYTVFIFSLVCGYGQNLVPNPSLEDTVFCPWAENQLPYYWTSYGASPDYLNGCSSALNVPNTPTGFHQANTGIGMIGFFNYVNPSSSGWPDYREFFGVQLLNQLIVGQKYYMSFHLSFARIYPFGWGGIGSDKLGMKFSTIPYTENSPPELNNSAHLYTDSIYTDTTQWVRVSGSFIADSAYNYVMFGNFFDEAQTDTLYFGMQQVGITSSYYFMDDICVSTDSIYNCTWTGLSKSQSDESEFVIYPNPADDMINIKGLNDIDEINLINNLGQIVYVMTVSNKDNLQFKVSSVPSGVYALKIKTNKRNYSKSILINH